MTEKTTDTADDPIIASTISPAPPGFEPVVDPTAQPSMEDRLLGETEEQRGISLYFIIGGTIIVLLFIALTAFLYLLGGDDQSALERLMNIAVIYIVFMSSVIVLLLAASTVAFVYLILTLRDKALPAMDELTATLQAGARHDRVHERGSGQTGHPGGRQGRAGGRGLPGLPQRQQAQVVSDPGGNQLIRPVHIEEAAALHALTQRSTMYWGYEPEFLDWEPESIAVTPEFLEKALASFALEEDGVVTGYYTLTGTPEHRTSTSSSSMRPSSAPGAASCFGITPSPRPNG